MVIMLIALVPSSSHGISFVFLGDNANPITENSSGGWNALKYNAHVKAGDLVGSWFEGTEG